VGAGYRSNRYRPVALFGNPPYSFSHDKLIRSSPDDIGQQPFWPAALPTALTAQTSFSPQFISSTAQAKLARAGENIATSSTNLRSPKWLIRTN
jgi:hypothetical protein